MGNQLHLINQQRDIDKIYLYAKDPYKAKYQFLINKRKSMIWMILTETLKNTTQMKNVKCKSFWMI